MSNYNPKVTALLTKENARDWKKFVADYLVIMTARKGNRDCVEGYQVKAVAGGYQILFGKSNPGYGVMAADVLYSWAERTPLKYFARQADDLRGDILMAS